MNKLTKITIIVLALVGPLMINLVFAQAVAPPPPPPPPVGVPIDGGIALLLGSLAAYGAKKFYGK